MKKSILLVLLALSIFTAKAQPSGTIIAFGGPKNKIPSGWLICDGMLYDRTVPKYTQLFNAIGVSWGGDGGNKFAVPDLRGMFLRGINDNAPNVDPDANSRTASRVDLNSAGNSGNAVGSKQADMYGSHTHSASATVQRSNIDGSNGSHDVSGGGDKYNADPGLGSLGVSVTINPSGGNETRPKNAYVYYIIKL